MERYILALDAGTTSERAILFNERGQIVASAAKPLTQIYPQPGWVEHDAMEILSAQLGVMTEVQFKSGIHSDQIAAIGITNQRETTIVWDRTTGKPLYNAIVWQCRRTSSYVESLIEKGAAPLVSDKTGLVLDPYFSASKIRWILEHVEGAREKAARGELAFGTVDSWLVYNLTGGARGGIHVTDHTNASRTMLFNIHTLDWDDELLELFDIPRSLLPQVLPSSGLFGHVTPDVARHTPPIRGVAGDQQASLFGHCCFEPGSVKNTYGTGCFMLMNTGPDIVKSNNGLLTTIGVSDAQGISYALEGSVFVAGAVVQWLRDELHLIEDAARTQELALSVPSSDGVYVVPAFTGLGAPYWNPEARGLICGLSRGTTKAHLVRAALESMAFQTSDIIDAMRADSGLKLERLAVDGGASMNAFIMQFQADLLGVTVERPQISESTALGAAYLAGLSCGYWPDRETLKQRLVIDASFEPRESAQRRFERIAGWRKAVERTLL